MKQHHGLPLTAVVPGPVRPQDTVAISNEDFARVDMWTIPRGAHLYITNVPALGRLWITRTTRSFRIDWVLLSPGGRLCEDYPGSILSKVMCEAARSIHRPPHRLIVRREPESIVFWLPLCRIGMEVLERVNNILAAIFIEADNLASCLPQALRHIEIRRVA